MVACLRDFDVYLYRPYYYEARNRPIESRQLITVVDILETHLVVFFSGHSDDNCFYFRSHMHHIILHSSILSVY